MDALINAEGWTRVAHFHEEDVKGDDFTPPEFLKAVEMVERREADLPRRGPPRGQRRRGRTPAHRRRGAVPPRPAQGVSFREGTKELGLVNSVVRCAGCRSSLRLTSVDHARGRLRVQAVLQRRPPPLRGAGVGQRRRARGVHGQPCAHFRRAARCATSGGASSAANPSRRRRLLLPEQPLQRRRDRRDGAAPRGRVEQRDRLGQPQRPRRRHGAREARPNHLRARCAPLRGDAIKTLNEVVRTREGDHAPHTGGFPTERPRLGARDGPASSVRARGSAGIAPSP